MNWEVAINLALQHLSPYLDIFWRAVTLLGEETVFLAVAMTLYFGWDQRFAFRLACVYLSGVIVVEVLKTSVARTRPFDDGTGIRSIGPRTHGYSFPSGHSHSIANLATQLCQRFGTRTWADPDGTARTQPRTWLVIVAATAVVATMVSRLYLGQHYVTDVVVGALLGVTIAIGVGRLMDLLGPAEHRLALVVAPLALVVGIIVALASPASTDIIKACGGIFGFLGGYYVQRRFVHCPDPARLSHAAIRILVGITIALLIKELPKLFLPATWPLLFDFVRYALLATWASLGAMVVFARLRI